MICKPYAPQPGKTTEKTCVHRSGTRMRCLRSDGKIRQITSDYLRPPRRLKSCSMASFQSALMGAEARTQATASLTTR